MSRTDSVQENIYLRLRDEIIHLERLPGSAMSIYEVSDLMGVSRTPVREAFIRLMSESLIQVLPQRRTLVSRIDFARVRQEHFLRMALETAALNTFLARAEDKHFARMQAAIDRQWQAVEQDDAKALLAWDDCFHQVIFEVAAQPLSWEIIRDQNGHDRRARMMVVRKDTQARHSIQEHEGLLSAFRERAQEEAFRLLDDHLESLIAQEDQLRQEYADYFEA